MRRAVFELGGALALAIPELSVGPWTCAPASIPAFAPNAGAPESVWRVELARDDAASRAQLGDGERSVARTHAVLDDLPRRLDRALSLAARGPAARSESAARDELGTPDRAPESALIAALISQAAPRPRADTALAQPPDSERGAGRLERVLDSIADLARGRARIATQVEGALVAHSIMTVSGDAELCLSPRLSSAGAQLHARSVAVAVRTRHAWARILAAIVAGCGRLLLLGLPAGGLAALPLVWRFVRDALSELRAVTATARAAP